LIHKISHLSDTILPMRLSEFLRKTLADQKSRVSEAGQTILEYILVLFITVSIILGIMYQFNDSFKQYIDTFFGDYIACLLETGELPALGGQGANQGECSKPEFDIAAGSPLVASRSGGDGSSGGSTSRSATGSGGGDSTTTGSNRPLRPSRVSSSGGSRNGDAANRRGSNSGRPSVQTQRKASDQNSSSPGLSGGDGDFGGGGNRRIVRKKIRYIDDELVNPSAKKKGKELVTKGKIKPLSGPGSMRPALVKMELPEKRKVASEEMSTGLSLGFFLKFFLIAGILIALFVFLGGQAMQIRKSWQKAE
jgi:hypothetical protein